jgi:hypothetical protein
MASDNDLNDHADFIVSRMGSLLSLKNPRVKVTIFYDGKKEHKSNISEGMIYQMGINGLRLIGNLGAVDSGNLDTFKSFIDNYVSVNSSIAQKNILIFWGHSDFNLSNITGDNPFVKMMNDDSTGSYFTELDILEAVKYFSRKIGKKIDLIGFDSCAMMYAEFAYLFRDYIKYYAGSQDKQNALSWNYTRIIDYINEVPKSSIRDFINNLVMSFEIFYKWEVNSFKISNNLDIDPNTLNDTISVIDVELLTDFLKDFINMIELVRNRNDYDNIKDNIKNDLLEPSSKDNWVDIYLFLDHLEKLFKSKSEDTSNIINLKNRLLDSKDAKVIVSYYTRKILKARGLSISKNTPIGSEIFKAFDKDDIWANFLKDAH